jgi:hypothetical protein
MIEAFKRQDGERLGQTRMVREVERIFQSHQKPATKIISFLNLTILEPTRHNPSSTRVSYTNK